MVDIDKEIENYIKKIELSDLNISEKVGNQELYDKVDEIDRKIHRISEVELNKYNSIISNLRLKERIQNSREEKLIASIINILDSIDWIFNSTLILENEALGKTVVATKKLINRELQNSNIVSTGEKGELYNENYHVCLGYSSNKSLTENEILENIKKGYIYKDKIVRQAQVIVVDNKGDEQGDNRY